MPHIIYPEKASAIIDVTKPPFCAIPDGKHDCTAALNKAIDFVLGEYEKELKKTIEKLAAMEDDNALILIVFHKQFQQ